MNEYKLQYKNFHINYSYRLDSNILCPKIFREYNKLNPNINLYKNNSFFIKFCKTEAIDIIKNFDNNIDNVEHFKFKVKSLLNFIIYQNIYKIKYKDGVIDLFPFNINFSTKGIEN